MSDCRSGWLTWRSSSTTCSSSATARAELPLSAVEHRHVIAGHRLPGPVPDLPQDRQRLPVVLQRPLQLTQTAVHAADVAQRGGLRGPVADLPPDRQRLPEVLQRGTY